MFREIPEYSRFSRFLATLDQSTCPRQERTRAVSMHCLPEDKLEFFLLLFCKKISNFLYLKEDQNPCQLPDIGFLHSRLLIFLHNGPDGVAQ